VIGGGDAIIEICGDGRKFPSHRHTRISIGPGRCVKPWGGFGCLTLALESITTECGGALGVSSDGDYCQIASDDTLRAVEGDALGARNTNALANGGNMGVEGTHGAGDFGVVDGVSLGTDGLSGADIRSVGDVFSGDEGSSSNAPNNGGVSVVGILDAGVTGSGHMGTGGYESASTSMKIVMASNYRPEAHSGRHTPLGQIHYLVQIRLGLGFDYLVAKSPLCIALTDQLDRVGVGSTDAA
jgi:hypothetical protein